jgi:hypothetical protein
LEDIKMKNPLEIKLFYLEKIGRVSASDIKELLETGKIEPTESALFDGVYYPVKSIADRDAGAPKWLRSAKYDPGCLGLEDIDDNMPDSFWEGFEEGFIEGIPACSLAGA